MEHTHTFESFLNESTEVSVEKITTPAERKALKNAFENIVTGIDKLSFKKDGTIEGKRGYFYRHGITPEKTAKELTSALKSQGINITVIDYYDDFKPWPKDSNFVVVFKISGVNESVNDSVNEATKNDNVITFKKFKDIDHTRLVKWMQNEFGNKYNPGMKWLGGHLVNGGDFELDVTDWDKRDLADLKKYLKSQSYISEGIVKDEEVKGKKVTNISQLK